MKPPFSTIVIGISLLTGLGNIYNHAHSNPKSTGDVQFICSQSYDQVEKEYLFTTFAWNPENKKPLIIWKREDRGNIGFDPQKRCELVSPRFQKAYDKNILKFMTDGTINNEPVICTVNQLGDTCETGILLLTLLDNEDPIKTLAQLSDILVGYTDGPLEQSSGDIVYRDGDKFYIKIDIEEFLSNE